MLGSFSNGGLGMGVAFTLEDQFSATASKIEASMAKLDGYTDQLGMKIERSMSQMKLGFGLAAAGSLLLAPIAASIKTAADFEQTQITFETLLGSVEKAKNMLNDLKSFSARTPFEFKDVTEFTKRLLAMGIQSQDVMGDMKALGDIAAGVGKDKLPSLVLAFGQVNTKGKLAGGELRQFAEAGVPLIAQLAKNFKVTEGAIGEMATKGEISFKDVRKALYDLTSGTGTFANLMDKQAASALGMWSNVKDNIYQAAINIGQIFLPVIKKVTAWIGSVVEKLKQFSESKFGKTVFMMIGVTGVLLVVLGTLLMIMGALRFAAYKAAGAFGMQTHAMIMQTFATKGMVAGLRAVGAAAWASLGPFILIAIAIFAFIKLIQGMKAALSSSNPYLFAFGAALMVALGPIGWVIGLITLFKRAIAEFNKVGQDGAGKQGGFVGFLQKIGGLLMGIKEVWNSWSDETRTFTIGDNLHKKLEAMGLLQTVVNIGTWIARIKWFLKGVRDGFKEAFNFIKNVIRDFLKRFQPITTKFNEWGVLINKNKSAMESWRDAGKKVAYVIVGALAAVAVAIIAIGAVALLTLAVIFLPFILLVYVIYKVVHALMELWAYFKGLGSKIYDAGVNMIKSLWQGMKDTWGMLKAWLAGKWEGLKHTLGVTSDVEYNTNMKQIAAENTSSGSVKPSTSGAQALGKSTVNNKAGYAAYRGAAAAPTVIHTKEEVVKNVTVQSHIDGRKMAEHVVDISKNNAARH